MYYRQPRYFGDFHCIGGECANSCCIGWRIDWTKEEIDKIKNAPNCSDELREMVEKSFEPLDKDKNDDKYIVALGEKLRCPFLTEDNFCKIQRELGEEYLSHTCASYPRHYTVSSATAYRYCNMSCPEIMNKLLNEEKSTDLVNTVIKNTVTIKNSTYYSEELIERNPELNYYDEIFELFYEIISDKKNDVEVGIILGALSAQQLTKIVEKKQYDRIPEAIKQIRSQLHDGAQLKSIENIQPNYHLKLGILGKFLDIIGYSMVAALNDSTGTPNIDLYLEGERRLWERFKDRSFFLRNIALNLFMEMKTPFILMDASIFENYAVYVVTFACLKLNIIATSYAGDELKVELDGTAHRYVGDQCITGLSSIITRGMCHNIEKPKALLFMLEQLKMLTPAYLALFVK